MSRRPRNIYVPLDVEFFDNDRVIQAGEQAGWLYLAMCCRAKRLLSDGVLTTVHIERLHVKGWRGRLKRLVDAGLVVETDDGRWLILGWLEKNLSAAQVDAMRAADRVRKGGSSRTDSERNPSGIRADPREVEVEEKRREVEVVPTTEGRVPAKPLRVIS